MCSLSLYRFWGRCPAAWGLLARLWAFGCCFLALLPATGSHQHTKSGMGTHRPSSHGSLSARQVPTSTRSLARGLHCLAALPAPGSHQHTQSGTGTPLAMVRPGPSASDSFPPALEVWHGGLHCPSLHGSSSLRQVPTSTRSLARGLHCLSYSPAPGSHQHTQSGTGTPLALVLACFSWPVTGSHQHTQSGRGTHCHQLRLS